VTHYLAQRAKEKLEAAKRRLLAATGHAELEPDAARAPSLKPQQGSPPNAVAHSQSEVRAPLPSHGGAPKRSRAAKLAKAQAHDERRLEGFRRSYEGMAHPPLMRRDVWLMSQQINETPGTFAVHYWLRWARSRYSGAPLARLRQAALQPQPDGTCKYDWGDANARRILAEGLIILRMSSHATAQQASGSRSRKQGLLLRGVSKQLLQVACTPRHRKGRIWHRNTLGNKGNDFSKLEAAGFMTRKRLPVSRLARFEVGNKSGQAITRYWVACVPTIGGRNSKAQRTALPERINAFELEQTRFQNENEVGWRACFETVVRTPRIRRATAPP
jgi:hypothetical protein